MKAVLEVPLALYLAGHPITGRIPVIWDPHFILPHSATQKALGLRPHKNQALLTLTSDFPTSPTPPQQREILTRFSQPFGTQTS